MLGLGGPALSWTQVFWEKGVKPLTFNTDERMNVKFRFKQAIPIEYNQSSCCETNNSGANLGYLNAQMFTWGSHLAVSASMPLSEERVVRDSFQITEKMRHFETRDSQH